MDNSAKQHLCEEEEEVWMDVSTEKSPHLGFILHQNDVKESKGLGNMTPVSHGRIRATGFF